MNKTLPVEVLFEDDAILVVDKPAGMMVHPAPGHPDSTLVDALLPRCPALAGVGSAERPGVVHRLDRETSGVMVLAKTQRAYLALRQAFEGHVAVEKTYLAVLHGAPGTPAGTVDAPVGRERLRAVTHWRVLAKHGPVALVEFRIETGRTHQIRVHAAHLGHPVAGDPLYGDAAADRRMRKPPCRTLLHAVGLAFDHPFTGKRLEVFAEPPPDILYAR